MFISTPKHKTSLESFPDIIFNIVTLWGHFECLEYIERTLFSGSSENRVFTIEQFNDLEFLQEIYIKNWKTILRHPISENTRAHNRLYNRLLKTNDAWVYAD